MNYLKMDEVPSLRNPILVMAFAGWNDAGEAATWATRFLIKGWSARPLASIDPEEFFDFTAARPMIRLTAGFQRELKWPSNAFFYRAHPSLSRDFILFLGTEPHLKWRAFSDAVVGLARQCGVSLIVGIGAYLGDAPHSRPVPLTGFATEPGLAERLEQLGITPSRYEGPTGIVGTIHSACQRQGLPAASLWAAVPHYLGATPNPKAALALLHTLDTLFDLHLELRELEETVAPFNSEVAEAVARNPDVAAYVQELERRADALLGEEAEVGPPTAELRGGEALIQELEEFLRAKREQEGEH